MRSARNFAEPGCHRRVFIFCSLSDNAAAQLLNITVKVMRERWLKKGYLVYEISKDGKKKFLRKSEVERIASFTSAIVSRGDAAALLDLPGWRIQAELWKFIITGKDNQPVPGNLNFDKTSVFPLMFPDNRRIIAAVAVGILRFASKQSGHILAGTNVLDGHAQEFRSRIAVLPNCGIIHGEKCQRLLVKDPHGMWVALKEETITTLRFQQKPFGFLLAGYVTAQALQFDDLAIFYSEL